MFSLFEDDGINSPNILGREGAKRQKPFDRRWGRCLQDSEESTTECEASKTEELKHAFLRRKYNAKARIDPGNAIECSPDQRRQDSEDVGGGSYHLA